MVNVHAREIDPRLLAIFDAVFVERSATRAAQRLGVTQSTVSHALNRLRDLFGDELFIRGPRGLKPSPRAMDLGPRIHRALADLQAAVSWEAFAPATTTRTFTVLLTLYGYQVLAPAIAARFSAEAPNARLDIRHPERPLVAEFDQGHADAAISVARPASSQLTVTPLFEDTWVAVVRPELAKGVKDARELQHLPHVALMPARGAGHSDDLVGGQGWALKELDLNSLELPSRLKDSSAQIRAPEAGVGLSIVRRLDAVALVPRRLALALGEPMGLKAFALPDEKQLPFALYSLKRSAGDPATDWILDLLQRAATEPDP